MVTSRHHKAALHPAKSCITTQCKQVPWYCSQLCSDDGTLKRCCARPQINKIMFSGLYDHLDAIHAVICGNFEEPMIEAQTFLESALLHCHFVIFGDRLGSCRKCCAACCRPAGGLQPLQRASCLVLARAQARFSHLRTLFAAAQTFGVSISVGLQFATAFASHPCRLMMRRLGQYCCSSP